MATSPPASTSSAVEWGSRDLAHSNRKMRAARAFPGDPVQPQKRDMRHRFRDSIQFKFSICPYARSGKLPLAVSAEVTTQSAANPQAQSKGTT